jgi:hypothetical protein
MLHALLEILAEIILEVLFKGLAFILKWINES